MHVKKMTCTGYRQNDMMSFQPQVACEDITGILKVSDLLTAGATQVGALCCRGEVKRMEVHETISDAVAKIGTMGFGLVQRGEDFFGIWVAARCFWDR